MVFDNNISFKSDDYLISYLDVPPHKLTMHLHNKYELLWLMHGDASYIIDDISYRLCEGGYPDYKAERASYYNFSFRGKIPPLLYTIFQRICKLS